MIRSFAQIFSANFAFGLAQWLVIVLIARLGNLEMQGQYSYVLAIVAPFTTLVRMSFRGVLATEQKGEFSVADYYWISLRLSLLANILLIAGYTIFSKSSGLVILLVGICSYKFLEGLSELFYGEFQRTDRLEVIFLSMVLRSAALVSGYLAGLLCFDSIIIGSLLVALLWLILFAGYDRRKLLFSGNWPIQPSAKMSISIVQRCWYLGVTNCLVSLFTYIPVYVLNAHLSLEEVGRYTSVSYFWVMGTFLTTAISQAYAAPISGLFHSNIRQYVKMIGICAVVLLCCGALVLALIYPYADEIIVALYGEQYAGLGNLLIIILVCVVLQFPASIFGLNMTIARSFSPMLAINVAAAVTVGGAALVLIPQYGLMGAGISLLYGGLVRLGISILVNARLLMKKMAETA